MTIFVQLTGRLGNQLFQIALGHILSKTTGNPFVIVYNGYNRYEQEWIHYFPEITFQARDILINSVCYSEKRPGINCFEYHPEILELCKKGNRFFEGYFQSWKYYNNSVETLKKMFLKNHVKETDGYFIHVRRGDYVNHPVYTIDYIGYFQQAIQNFPQDVAFYVVSDDIAFCKTWDLFRELNVSYVELDTLETLHFMAGCRGGICANSSFSWWGAFLGRREIVTMPRQWINNGMDTSEIPFPGVIIC